MMDSNDCDGRRRSDRKKKKIEMKDNSNNNKKAEKKQTKPIEKKRNTHQHTMHDVFVAPKLH